MRIAVRADLVPLLGDLAALVREGLEGVPRDKKVVFKLYFLNRRRSRMMPTSLAKTPR